jgi:hypothetical protein
MPPKGRAALPLWNRAAKSLAKALTWSCMVYGLAAYGLAVLIGVGLIKKLVSATSLMIIMVFSDTF